jgi:N-ethylmaleimide reductase
MTIDLFSGFKLGRLTLPNRIVMAPMTRSRAIGNVPNALVAEYYAQRAEAGLIITEGTSPSPNGLGYSRIPGLFNAAHVAGWRQVTDAVHAKGSRIFVQLMHTGRVGHPENLPAGARILAPSAVTWDGKMYVDGKGELPVPTAQPMTEADIEEAIGEYVRSAELAIEAGFDGVELHGANGYLIEQFLNTAANQRTDAWGGSVEGRARFAIEVGKRTAKAIGGDRVGIRVSPYGVNGGLRSVDDHVDEVHETVARGLRDAGFLYIHIVDHTAMGAPPVPPTIKEKIQHAFGGPIILAGGYDLEHANADLQAKRADLIAFGRPFIANPRLPSKLKNGSALATPDFTKFFTPGPEGYTDYPLET